MVLKEAIIQAGVIFGVFMTIGYIILMKVKKSNPKAAEWLDKFKLGNIYNKMEEQNPITESIQQVYDDKRTMM